jgi:hypothetical protein
VKNLRSNQHRSELGQKERDGCPCAATRLKAEGLKVNMNRLENPARKDGETLKTHEPKETKGITAPSGKRLYPLKEAAQYLGRSEWGMRELIWARKIPVVREGRKIYLDIHDLEEYVVRNKSLYN